MALGGSKSKSPLSEGGKGRKNMGCLMLFGGIFLLVGLGVMTAGIGWPTLNIIRAQSWIETPCTIVSSEVITNNSSDGDTYRIAITYRYDVDGQAYTGTRYDFSVGSSSGYDGKADVVSEYPVNSRAICYVNPDNPSESVINRGFSMGYLWFGLFGGVFALVGGSFVFGARFANQKAERAEFKTEWVPKTSDTAPAAGMAGGEVTLKPKSGPLGKFFGLLFAAVFWNGVVGILLYVNFIKDGPSGFSWFVGLFLIPFVLIGIVIIGAAIQQFLAIFNPRPVLTASTNAPRLGETVDLRWTTSGAVKSIHSLTFVLIGREVAIYQRGTNTVTDRESFAELTIDKIEDTESIRSGKTSFSIPIDAMHSFDAKHNKVEWLLQVKGDIKRWPDVADEYPLLVMPAPAGGPLG